MASLLPIHICSLEAVKEADVSIYDGVITIEDSRIREPFRVEADHPPQLVLCFDDISVPIDDFIEPQEKHILQALSFANRIGDGSLLIHCHAGISRSSAIALAIIAQRMGMGKEQETIETLESINPHCRPNKSIVWLTDEILGRDRKLYDIAYKSMWLTN